MDKLVVDRKSGTDFECSTNPHGVRHSKSAMISAAFSFFPEIGTDGPMESIIHELRGIR